MDGYGDTRTFKLNKVSGRKLVSCNVYVNDCELRWQSDCGSATAKNNCSLLTRQILIARTSRRKNEDSVVEVHYAVARMSGFTTTTKIAVEKFHGSLDDCETFREAVENVLARVERHRPKRFLVFVNPGSGSSDGERSYRRKVEPLMELAGVTRDVVVTEHVNHAREVIDGYDLSSVDAVAVVGGDGTVTHVCSALLRRAQRDAGIDLDDENASLVGPSVPVAVFPAGTGNGLAAMLYGSFDLESAVICAMLGYRISKDVTTVHTAAGAFVEFSLLLLGYGFFSAIIDQSERNRRLGKLRYALAIGTHFFRPPRFDVDIEYLKCVESSNSSTQTWERFTGPVFGVQTLPDVYNRHLSNVERLSNAKIMLSWIKPCSLRDRFRLLRTILAYKNIDELEFMGCADATRVRLKSSGEWCESRLARIIDWDGEVLELAEPGFENRLHVGILEMIGLDMTLPNICDTTTGT